MNIRNWLNTDMVEKRNKQCKGDITKNYLTQRKYFLRAYKNERDRTFIQNEMTLRSTTPHSGTLGVESWIGWPLLLCHFVLKAMERMYSSPKTIPVLYSFTINTIILPH